MREFLLLANALFYGVSGVTVARSTELAEKNILKTKEKDQGSTEGTALLDSEKTIWTWWEGPQMGPLHLLNLETWKHNSPGMKLVILNNSNIKHYVPDLPEEFFKFPYQAAQSDFIRAALLHHHGGIYMDTDFIVFHSLDDVIQKLKTNGMVAYQSGQSDSPSGKCALGGKFSSNFMAGRKGNLFSTTWYNNIKQRITRTCEEGGFDAEKVCCHAKGSDAKTCHIPWAALEQIKDPTTVGVFHGTSLIQDGARVGQGHGITGLDPRFTANIPSTVKMFCYKGHENFDPVVNYLYWQPWDEEKKQTRPYKLDEFNDNPRRVVHEFNHERIKCTTTDGDLNCDRAKYPVHIKNFFGRTMYHLAFSTWTPEIPTNGRKGEKPPLTRESILKSNWLLSAMYRESLGLPHLK